MKNRCLCDICTRITPMQVRIMEALPTKQLRYDFMYLMNRMELAETDNACNELKLSGQWPGWEWMKAARKKAEEGK